MVSGLIISETVTIVGNRAGGKAGKMIYDNIKDNCKIFCQNNPFTMMPFTLTFSMMELSP